MDKVPDDQVMSIKKIHEEMLMKVVSEGVQAFSWLMGAVIFYSIACDIVRVLPDAPLPHPSVASGGLVVMTVVLVKMLKRSAVAGLSTVRTLRNHDRYLRFIAMNKAPQLEPVVADKAAPRAMKVRVGTNPRTNEPIYARVTRIIYRP